MLEGLSCNVNKRFTQNSIIQFNGYLPNDLELICVVYFHDISSEGEISIKRVNPARTLFKTAT